MSAKVEAKGVTKRFGDLVALSDFSLEIAPGEIFGLIGPNGAGKTTFIRVLTGFWLPTSGDVWVDGLSVVRERFAVQERIGYACEQPKLYTDHTVQSFLRMMGQLRGLSGAVLREAVDRGVDRFSLESVRGRRIGVLSKGFRQRVSLAQAMLHEPELIVIDEPTVGLDPKQQIELRRIIQSFRGQHTVLLCTHQLREAEFCCDRVALLDRGRLARISSAEEISVAGSLEELFLTTVRGASSPETEAGARAEEETSRVNRLFVLLRKELRSLFASPIAYVVLTAYVSLTGVYFFQHLVAYNQLLFVYQSEAVGSAGFDAGTVPSQINALNELFIPASNDFSLFLLAVLPLVTMRVFAEERANGTDELLLTTPIRAWELALAKHLTTYGFVTLLLAVSAIYPAVVVSRSALGVPHLVALFAGQLFYGCAVAAIGLACSSLTKSQIVAAVLAYAIPFVMLDFNWLSNSVTEGVAAVLREMSLMAHYDAFPRGVIELRHGLYFGGIVALGLTVSMASIEMSRAR